MQNSVIYQLIQRFLFSTNQKAQCALSMAEGKEVIECSCSASGLVFERVSISQSEL